jgi:hypothetical protein
MGLAERRATKDFQDKLFPTLKAEIEKLAGFAVPLEINWEQLAKDDYASSYDESWKKVFFQPVIDALKKITRDQMGKDAIKSGLKKVVFCNTKGAYSPSSAITFTGGELVVDHDPVTNIDYIDDRTNHMVTILEKAL